MIAEPFADGRSVIHRSNPDIRIVLAAIYSSTTAVLHRPAGLAIALGFGTALVLLARLPLLPLLKRLAAAAGLLLMIWLLVPWTYPGLPLWRIAGMTFSHPGVDLCIQISLKTLAILTAFSALVATMRLSTLGRSLRRLGVPAKLVQLLLLAYRYLFVIEQEYQRLYRAARIRNFRPGNNLHTYRTYAYMLGMLFVRATERAARVYRAMKCRGFDGRFHSLDQFTPSACTPILSAAVLLASAALVYLEFSS